MRNGVRLRDTQCGLFATGKVLRRFGVPFTHLTNCRLNGQVNYALEGNLNYTGAVITWLKEDVSLIASASESEQLARQGFPADYMTRRRSLRTRTAAASHRRWIIPSAKHAAMVGRKLCGKR